MAIVLVDYHKGNIRSVQRGLQAAGAQVLVSDSPEDVRRAEAVVLPGVGAYRDASDTLQELGLMGALRDACDRGRALLGESALGCTSCSRGAKKHASASSPAPGLGLLPGVVGRVSPEDAGGPSFQGAPCGLEQRAPCARGTRFCSCPAPVRGHSPLVSSSTSPIVFKRRKGRALSRALAMPSGSPLQWRCREVPRSAFGCIPRKARTPALCCCETSCASRMEERGG